MKERWLTCPAPRAQTQTACRISGCEEIVLGGLRHEYGLMKEAA